MSCFKKLLSVLLVLGLGSYVSAQSADDDVLLRALQDEMDRSLNELQLEDEPKPYFISYTVTESSNVSAKYVLGAHESTSSGRNRSLTVKVRVGSPELDNTNFLNMGGGFSFGFGGVESLPLTDNYDEMRRKIWIATDEAYKSAVADLSAKKSALEAQTETDRPNDFSEEEPFTYMGNEPASGSNIDAVSAIAGDLSKAFVGQPDIQTSSATVSASLVMRLYMDSQGNFNRDQWASCRAVAGAKTQTTDGASIADSISAYADECWNLPDIDNLKKDAVAMTERLLTLRTAETLETYNGPVLFVGQAAGEMMGQVLSARLGNQRIPTSSNPNLGASLSAGGNPFVDKIDARVLPRSFSVVNDPTITEYEGSPLLGSYVVDDEGMPSRRTELVTRGMLKTLLTNRAPTKISDNTSGSSRGGQPLPGNLFIETSDGVSMEDLKAELFSIASDNGKEFAVVIRKLADVATMEMDPSASMQLAQQMMGGSGGLQIMPALDVVKVFPDGTEVPVLPVTITNFADSYLKDIVAASAEVSHYDIMANPMSGGMGGIFGGLFGGGGISGLGAFISVVTPDVLFEDLTLRSGGGAKPKLPLVPHPLAEE